MGTGRILIVDDTASARLALREILEEEGYDVAVADNGVDALRVAAREHPDVALVDIGAPRASLFSMARLAPVVIGTGTTDPPPPLSRFPFFRKPVALGALLGAIATALARPRVAAPV